MTESMRWLGSVYSPDHPNDALAIVAWVNANGGLAEFESPNGAAYPRVGPRIAVRTRDDWQYCAPGQWVVMGEGVFRPAPGKPGLREFTVEDRLITTPELPEATTATRVSVIDYRTLPSGSDRPRGLVLEVRNAKISATVQDDGRTLKIWINDKDEA